METNSINNSLTEKINGVKRMKKGDASVVGIVAIIVIMLMVLFGFLAFYYDLVPLDREAENVVVEDDPDVTVTDPADGPDVAINPTEREIIRERDTVILPGERDDPDPNDPDPNDMDPNDPDPVNDPDPDDPEPTGNMT